MIDKEILIMEVIIEEEDVVILKETLDITMKEDRENITQEKINMMNHIKRSRNLLKKNTTQRKKNKMFKVKINFQKNN